MNRIHSLHVVLLVLLAVLLPRDAHAAPPGGQAAT
jgi:hypothetical protein